MRPSSRRGPAASRPRAALAGLWPALATLLVMAAVLAVPSAVADAPTLSNMPGDQTVGATSLSGAVVGWTDPTATDGEGNPTSVSCSPASGSTFPIGVTVVSCTATDTVTSEVSPPQTFSVTVTPLPGPSVSVPADITANATSSSGAVVTYSASASDPLDPSPALSCSPASGSTFPLGPTTVTCTATDSFGLSASKSFTVTVVDTTPPSISTPGAMSAEATSSSGAVVTYSASASDPLDPSPGLSCSPASGSTFPLGPTTVTCTATDSFGLSSSKSFTVTVVDTTPPSISVPAGLQVPATSPGGAVATYSASASDLVDGAVTPSCHPPSGSAFPIGQTTVSCSAGDSHGNSSSVSFTLSIVDRGAPSFSGVPSNIKVEADGPAGTSVGYQPPSAIGLGQPVPVRCHPTPGAIFPLGTSTVTCGARDAAGNQSSVSFNVTVVDTTPPVLNVPKAITLSSQGKQSVPKNDATVTAFLAAATAKDAVDGSVPVANDAPAVLPLGTTTIDFSAADQAGNRAKAQSAITLVSEPAPPPKITTTKIANVRKLRAQAGDHFVLLSWITPQGADHVAVSRSPGKGGAAQSVVYQGSARRFRDADVTDGVQYRYLVVVFDASGNRSAGLGVRALPRLLVLLAPSDGGTVRTPPVLKWRPVPHASYYNVQLYRIARGREIGIKIFSKWPSGTRLHLLRGWSYASHQQQLTPGRYSWFVWPGFGARTAARYGKLLGQSSFTFSPRG